MSKWWCFSDGMTFSLFSTRSCKADSVGHSLLSAAQCKGALFLSESQSGNEHLKVRLSTLGGSGIQQL